MSSRWLSWLLMWLPVALLAALFVGFGSASPRFLTWHNLGGILSQSSGFIVVTLGMSLVLLTAGVDLSVGSAMYLAAAVVGLGLHSAPVWLCLLGALLVGALFGAINGLVIVGLRLPAFIVTLSMLFVGRGVGLYLSDTRIVYAGAAVAEWGRTRVFGIPGPLTLAIGALLLVALITHATPSGVYIRAIGSDRESAERTGVPVQRVLWSTYCACGALAGLGGFISLSQTSAASGAFGEHAEFLAIAAAVLGGASLFGGRGNIWSAPIGAVLITTVQNGLVMIDADPYAYPVITGGVIFFAALVDGFRLSAVARLQRDLGRLKRA
jgi:ribose/xylose/arabinose/galactoside ABC-type transport system permease subunit